jgi:hypothetical protein
MRRAAHPRAARTAAASRDGLPLLLLLSILIFLLLLLRPSRAQAQLLQCGSDLRLELVRRAAPGEGLQRADSAAPKAGSTDIVLQAGAGLSGRPQALSAWNAAVAIWEEVLDDAVTVTIAGDITALGPGVLGSTQPVAYSANYTTIRNAVVADAEADEPSAQALPTLAQKQVALPPGFVDSGSVLGTKANLKALGFDMSFDSSPDATIRFNSSFESQFDYDPSDGIAAGKYDFVAIVVHEIGHALGFSSEVDLIDFYRSQNQVTVVYPHTLDLFRLLPDTSADFSTTARCLRTGDLAPTQIAFVDQSEWSMSTGVQLGDGRQASHWKADELSGSTIGIMDPTMGAAQHLELSETDVRAMGLIGWDVLWNTAPTPVPTWPGSGVRLSAAPNPFNPRTTLVLSIAVAGSVTIEVFNAAGRRLEIVHQGELEAGEHAFHWDGRDRGGNRLPSGIYFVRARAARLQTVLKLVMLE